MPIPKKPPAWKTLGVSLNRNYEGCQKKARSYSRKTAALRRGWQETYERRAAKLRHVPTTAERAAAARRRAARVTLGQRAAKASAAFQAYSRLRFAGLLAVPKVKLWRQAALLLGAVAAVSVAGNVLMYFRFSPARPLVTIGRHVIRDREYRADLDNAAGQPVLTRLVFAELIRQAAAKAGVTPTPAEINARLALLQRRGQAVPGSQTPEFQDGLALNLALENLRVAGVTASESEIAAFYKQHSALLAQPAQVQSILVVTQREYVAQTAAGLLAKGKSASEIAAQPDMQVDGEDGFHINLSALPPAAHQAVVGTALAMHPGQITVMPLGNVFLTIKCLHRLPGSLPPLPQVRDQIARLVQLQKAPSAGAEMALLYQANKPDFDVDRYAAYFADIGNSDFSSPPAVPKTAGLP